MLDLLPMVGKMVDQRRRKAVKERDTILTIHSTGGVTAQFAEPFGNGSSDANLFRSRTTTFSQGALTLIYRHDGA